MAAARLGAGGRAGPALRVWGSAAACPSPARRQQQQAPRTARPAPAPGAAVAREVRTGLGRARPASPRPTPPLPSPTPLRRLHPPARLGPRGLLLLPRLPRPALPPFSPAPSAWGGPSSSEADRALPGTLPPGPGRAARVRGMKTPPRGAPGPYRVGRQSPAGASGILGSALPEGPAALAGSCCLLFCFYSCPSGTPCCPPRWDTAARVALRSPAPRHFFPVTFYSVLS